MSACRTALWSSSGWPRSADWVARGNRIEFPSTERGKRQECGGLDSQCMLCVCNRSSITLILTMSLGNENTNSTCINGGSAVAQRGGGGGIATNTISNNGQPTHCRPKVIGKVLRRRQRTAATSGKALGHNSLVWLSNQPHPFQS